MFRPALFLCCAFLLTACSDPTGPLKKHPAFFQADRSVVTSAGTTRGLAPTRSPRFSSTTLQSWAR